MVQQVFLASLHGHSHYSDGIPSVKGIVRAAGQQGITYLAVTDHDSVAGVYELYDEAAKYNRQHKHQILPIAGIELKVGHGEVILMKPDKEDQVKKFVNWCLQLIHAAPNLSMIATVVQAIKEHQALVVFPHPGLQVAGMHSVSFEFVKGLAHHLSPEQRRHVGLEVNNWAAKVFLGVNTSRERQVDMLAAEYNWARIGAADYHAAWQVDAQTTAVPGKKASYQELAKAFKLRQVRPAEPRKMTKQLYAQLSASLAVAVIKSLRK
jgi:histidinol phosphatase-like PHP family hydrolase